MSVPRGLLQLHIASQWQLSLIKLSLSYMLEKKYPEGSSNNEKRIIRRKAATLKIKDGEVFYLKSDKATGKNKVVIAESLTSY